MTPIYLDYAASTPLDQRVLDCMLPYLTLSGAFGNPASLHAYGRQAKEGIEAARVQVADCICADPSEIIWTSGATESNNLALKGAAHLYRRKGQHVVTVKTEHKAVLDPCQQLEKEGYRVTYLSPERSGLLDVAKLEAALCEDTILVSVMQVNNETGVIQDLAAIANLTSARGILLHVDAAQSIGKIAVDVSALPIDLLSLSAHKAYGPKGIGALYLRKKPRVRVEPLIQGGGHEQGMRSGTLPTHQIVGMGAAFALAKQLEKTEHERITSLRQQLLTNLQSLPCIHLTTNTPHIVPHILNLRFEGMLADALLAQLPMIATSTASACQGKGTEGSYVLRAMGLSDAEAKSAVRFSFGRFTMEEDIKLVADEINKIFASSN